MWKLDKIEARNLCAFRELHYTLKQGVTTLVYGDNRDNESQRSNGSGKSALIESIALGITGSPLRKIRSEEIINDSADECFVALCFSNTASNERFFVEREIYRKGSSVVVCRIERDGAEVQTDEAVQSSVDNYNRYILEKLGISREELFNNFILSKHRYEDFLSCSDKEKKEIINRFSNGILIDQAIEKIVEDKSPVEKSLSAIDLELAGIDGRVQMLTEQIENEESGKDERAKTKVEKIAALQQTITDKRDAIRGLQAQIEARTDIAVNLNTADSETQLLEQSEESLEICFAGIKSILEHFGKLTDWGAVMSNKRDEIAAIEKELKQINDNLDKAQGRVDKHTGNYDVLKSDHSQFVERSTKKSEGYKAELSRLDEQITRINTLSGELRSTRRNLTSAIESLGNKIAGTITCPQCSFEFLTSDKEFDVEVGRISLEKQKGELSTVATQISTAENELSTIEQSQSEIREYRRKLNIEHSEWLGRVAVAEKEVQSATYELESLGRKQRQITEKIVAVQGEIEGLRRKMFDEAYEIIDSALRSENREVKLLKEEVTAAESSIETLYTTIGELNNATDNSVVENLRTSLREYREKSAEVADNKREIERELERLEEQEQRFIQFKTYLANTKIEALSQITNDFLTDIGSDIRIRFSGYTVLKTGKIREKISISLIRDGLDCGSFGKFSEGEKARVNLASILAMQKLVNSNCDTDKGLDLIVLDEILEAVDEQGLANMFEALNRLNITALVVSHGNTAESYPHKLIIIKENGQSYIET